LEDSPEIEEFPKGVVGEYVAELYNRMWDTACVLEKEFVDVVVMLPSKVGGTTMTSWSEIAMDSDVQASGDISHHD
jgi:hypothetical protein